MLQPLAARPATNRIVYDTKYTMTRKFYVCVYIVPNSRKCKRQKPSSFCWLLRTELLSGQTHKAFYQKASTQTQVSAWKQQKLTMSYSILYSYIPLYYFMHSPCGTQGFLLDLAAFRFHRFAHKAFAGHGHAVCFYYTYAMNACMYTYIRIPTSIYTPIYTYVCVYKHIYIYTCIYIYVYGAVSPCR